MPANCVIEPTHEISSTVNGPLDKGVSLDCNVCSAGDNQPRPHPTDIVARFPYE